jgi:hypothetical protein
MLAVRTVDQSNSESPICSRIFISWGTHEFGEQGIIDLIGISDSYQGIVNVKLLSRVPIFTILKVGQSDGAGSLESSIPSLLGMVGLSAICMLGV